MAGAEEKKVDLGEDEKAEVDLGEEDKSKVDLGEDCTDETLMPSPEEQELAIKKKYGGLLPKKPPLISKDHERAFFDSADWALGKKNGEQPGQKPPKSLIESLRPKLQPTQHQPLPARRSLYESSENEVDGAGEGNGDGEALSRKEEAS